MIAYVEGSLTEIHPSHVVVDCNGVGYLARISTHTYGLLSGQSRARVWTHLQVKEDAHVLYGFAELEERMAFELLIGISGVGGGTALTVLSGLSAAELAAAVARADVTALKRIKGIGQKTAERIVLELRDRLNAPAAAGSATPRTSVGGRVRDEALQALTGLGFARAQVEQRVDALLASEPNQSLEAVVKAVLRGA